ncbi:hypothetical protein B0H19DRAFT_886796, partial [Mycena capillaripes]
LPMRGSKTAPTFDGKPAHLDRYFRDVKDTGDNTDRTSDTELMDMALRYLDIDDEQLWKRKKTGTMTFDEFKMEIRKLYPGSDGEKLYTWADLREVVRKGQEKPPSNKDEFGEYQRNFQRISDFLKSKNKISDRERDKQFMKGICSDFRFRVLQRLQIVMPDQPSDTPYAIGDVIKAAEWAIDGTPGQFYQDTEEDTTIIKKEMVDLTASMREMRTVLSNLTRRTETQFQPFREAQNSEAGNRGPGGAFEEGKCGFCSEDGHFMRACPTIEEYIKKGMCKRNQFNRIVLPNGMYIPRAITGKNFIEQIENWHKQQPAQTTASANLYERD